MSDDASLPPNAPMTNGQHHHGEADASSTAASSSSSSSSSSSPSPSLAHVCADLNARVSAFLSKTPGSALEKRTQDQTRLALAVIAKALQEYDFNSLSLSYNGGKDCLVLLILYLVGIHTHFTTTSSSSRAFFFPTSIPSIYACPPDPFPAVTSFVSSSSRGYHLDLTHISTTKPSLPTSSSTTNPTTATATATAAPPPAAAAAGPRVTFRDAFSRYLTNHPTIKAIFVGTRRTDPHGADLTHFDRTDKGWPDFMRVHPVIDWKLSEIWCFLRANELGEGIGDENKEEEEEEEEGEKAVSSRDRERGAGKTTRKRKQKLLPYCTMYDQGYTSLGGMGDTLRNPKLRYCDADGRERYKPAYQLTEDDEERLGRE